jgi:hypothetical protein
VGIDMRLDRDSVAAGDDVEAHARELSVDPRRLFVSFLREIVSDGYLPLIEGGHATWIVRTSRRGDPLAVLAQRRISWDPPTLIIEPSAEVEAVGSGLYFEYRAQAQASDVVAELRETP